MKSYEKIKFNQYRKILSRRNFIKTTSLSSLAIITSQLSSKTLSSIIPLAANFPDLIVAEKWLSAKILAQKAIEALGGMQRFVKKGATVLVKPNIGWDRNPEQAANTNPEVVAEVVRLCLEAGAKQVNVFDRPCNDPRRCYHNSGIQEAVEKAGGKIFYMRDNRYKKISIPKGEVIKEWLLYEDAILADVKINVPVAKHHGLSKVSLGLKNWMGVMGGDRGVIHQKLAQALSDLMTVLKADLTVLDATRILLANGPQGGNIKDVKINNQIIVGVDPVAVDAIGATLFGLKPSEFETTKVASARGLGRIDLENLNILRIAPSAT